jgi:subtilisin family serine protease
MLNYQALPVTAEALVDVLSGRSNPPNAAQLIQRFQHPVSAKLLITASRLPATVRQGLPESNPDEILHRYIVLEFADVPATLAAKAILLNDAGIRYVKESENAQFLAIPSDPLYAYSATSNRDYQWAVNDALLLQGAWDTVRGTAYLAQLDNGVQTLPVLHEDLGQPFRRFKFNVAGGEDVDEHPELTADDGTGTHGAAGHGTHTAGIMAGATSQASVPAGYPNPSPAVGISGVCWYCSLLVAKVSRRDSLQRVTIDAVVDVPAAVNWAVNAGAQAINISFGGRDPNCSANPYDAYCAALNSAASKGVVIVAAAGNSDFFNDPAPGGSHVGNALGTILDFPASNSNTIAAGATQQYAGGFVGREYLWTEENPRNGFYGSSSGPGMETRGILAPGRAILSTFYGSSNWNVTVRCGTMPEFIGLPGSTDYGPGTTKGPKYGLCTGTSMAAPHITGIVGLMRTVNPLLDATQIRSMLLSSGYNAATPNQLRGYGIANANTAVSNVLATTNRLTPLFGSYSSTAADHFYSVVPQMARASVAGGLIPYAVASTSYTPYGTSVSEYPGFADPQLINYVTPKADVWVFTTHSNPATPSVELMPLYRLSWKCGDGGVSICGTNPYHVSHFYTTTLSEAQSYINSNHYQFDGIEGYVYPLSQAQPTGTTALIRAYNSASDDYALFPADQQAAMAAQGYSFYVSYQGYVYRNTGSRPSY